MLSTLLFLVACKKDVEPEVAAEPIEVIDPATSITVRVPDGTNKVKFICKDTGAEGVAEVSGKEVVLSGMTGSQCHLIFQPQGKKSTTVNAGTSVSCVDVNGEDKVTCREL